MREKANSPGVLTAAFLYLIQVPFWGFAIMIAAALISPLLSFIGLDDKRPIASDFVGYFALLCILMGLVTGWVVGKQAPSLVAAGRWLWVLPVIFVAPDVISELSSLRSSPYLPGYFFATGANEGFEAIFMMLPTCSLMGYSLGIALTGTRSKWERLTHLSSMMSVITIGLAWVALFIGLGLLAHRLEHFVVERWSRILMVHERSGLRLFPDANELCSTRTPGAAPQLPFGIEVETLERRTCSNGDLLDKDAPPPAGSWNIERVKVLRGPHIDARGWAPSHGLRQMY